MSALLFQTRTILSGAWGPNDFGVPFPFRRYGNPLGSLFIYYRLDLRSWDLQIRTTNIRWRMDIAVHFGFFRIKYRL